MVIAGLNLVAIVALVLAEAHTGGWHAPSVLWGGTLVVIAGVCATIAQHRTTRTDELRDAREEIPRRLARVVEYRDNDTGGHIERMAEYSGLIATALGLDPDTCRRIRLASTMHDIGKVAVPDSVLLKPGKLTAYERAVMERHAQVGYEMLTGSGSELLDLAATIALTHHERFDGKGYPRKLEADQIPLPGRIVAVADVFDAVTSKRVYKDAGALRGRRDA
jgi:putative two-component system response regulator